MGSTKPYDWSQSDSEVAVRFPVEANVGKEALKVKIESLRLSVVVKGTSIFNSELGNRVVVDDSYWSLEGSGESRALVVTLCKKKDKVPWKGVTKEEEEHGPEPDVLAPDFDVMALEHDDDDPERVEEQEQNEIKLEARYKKLLAEKGLQDEATLQTFFALFDNCIQLYRLNKLFDYLQEVVPECRKRSDKYKLKAVQALAFVLWKQSKFREALPLFHEMEEILGKGAALCENIAHTYNSLGDYEKAEEYFRQSLKFIEQEHGMNRGNRGGVLLGLGLVRDRLGKHREALPVIKQAYEFYKERANGGPASLQAKAGISCAKLHAKLGELPQAEAYIREAVAMYEITCGETSPLTASAYHELGRCLWGQRKRHEAQEALSRAYDLEAMKDAWDLVTLLEIHNALMDTHLKETQQIERQKFQKYFKTVEFVVQRVRKNLPQDGNAAVYFKAAAELKAWGGRYQEARALFQEAIPLFTLERATDCSNLIQACKDMLAFCDRNLEGSQNSPMDFAVPGQDNEAEEEENTGPKIEEVEEDDEPIIEQEAPSADAAAAVRSAMAMAEAACEYRLAQPSDHAAAASLWAACGRKPVLADEAAFRTHLAGAGAGLCWAAVGAEDTTAAGSLSGLAICGSDGVYGHVLQLLATAPVGGEGGEAAEDVVRRGLVERCQGACRERGLRALRAEGAVGGDNGGELFESLGWNASTFIYSSPPTAVAEEPKAGQPSTAAPAGVPAATPAASSGGGGKGYPSGASAKAASAGAAAARASSSSAAAAPKAFDTWEKMNVEKALAAEEGKDPEIVPDNVVPKEEFGDLGSNLDVSTKITKFAWDQSKQSVSIYISFDGAGSLAAEDVECAFRPRGVLLVIRSGNKRHWYKMPNLCQDIDTAGSTKKVKSDQVVLKLRKQEQGRQWSDLGDEKDRYQRQREYRLEHGDLKGATTEQLLADMYEHANDDERSGLRDAMRVNRQKREGDHRAAASG